MLGLGIMDDEWLKWIDEDMLWWIVDETLWWIVDEWLAWWNELWYIDEMFIGVNEKWDDVEFGCKAGDGERIVVTAALGWEPRTILHIAIVDTKWLYFTNMYTKFQN